jgi:ABC-type sugar transport system ATPase subunit
MAVLTVIYTFITNSTTIGRRIYVMKEGAIIGELAAREASQEKIMSMIVKG